MSQYNYPLDDGDLALIEVRIAAEDMRLNAEAQELVQRLIHEVRRLRDALCAADNANDMLRETVRDLGGDDHFCGAV